MKISVVIVTYNRIELLKECIAHVLNQTVSVYETIIINNCSTDGTCEYLEKFAHRNDIKIISMSKNLGGAAGFENGLRNVSDDSDYAIVIDDDAILSLDYVEKMILGLENGVEAYSGTVKTDGKIVEEHRSRIKDYVDLKFISVPKEDYQGEYFYYDLSSFCGLMISTKLMKKIGFPKGEYFIWADDTEYSLRIRKYSRIKNINTAVLNHKTVLYKSQEISWKDFYGYRNQIDMGKFHSSKPVYYVIKKVLFHLKRFLGYTYLYLFDKENRERNRKLAMINRDVLLWLFTKKMGIDEKYYPGMKW